jgi:hypothetical protein
MVMWFLFMSEQGLGFYDVMTADLLSSLLNAHAIAVGG